MNLADDFNALNGTTVNRKTLNYLLARAEKEKHNVIQRRVLKVLESHPTKNEFKIKIVKLIEPYGLNAVSDKKAAVSTIKKNQPKKVKKIVSEPKKIVKKVKKNTEKPKKELVLKIKKPVKPSVKQKIKVRVNARNKGSIIPVKKNDNISSEKPVKAPKKEAIKIVVEEVKPTLKKEIVVNNNRSSLAYKMANRNTNFEHFDISNNDLSEFLGEIEIKEKESIVISLTGGQGSMKTRFAFQFMNALAQKYNCGHASIEEHPESKLYFDKADQYLNEKALNNIEAPEIKNLSDLEKLIKNNDVIIIDSYAKMQEIEKGFEVDKDLRKKYNGKLFLVIFQQTTDGKMRGGSKSQFDADIVLFTEKKDDYKNNYVYADKNRYQSKSLDSLHFNIFSGKLNKTNQPVQSKENTNTIVPVLKGSKLSFIIK